MKIIDLSVSIHTGMDVYPGDPAVSVEIVHTHEQNQWELRQITMGSHTGTHVDAFSHMNSKGKSLTDMPLTHFFGKSYVARPDQDFPIRAGLFFREAAGIELFDKIKSAQAPFVGGLISEELQRALLSEQIVTYTDLANLELLPEQTPFMFYGFPLKIKDGDGSPVRAVAMLDFFQS
ncbi:cyclase family protein [Paenibacillus sp. NPDC056579]|uniref:cyclase family protein n=1 Tax=Paenibacillus sp. NPDC056579 TaxID=3345871 RepID=UPI003687F415